MSEIKRVKLIIEGRVQGIGYRWFIQDKARITKIGGWVKNLCDGNVEVVAEGPKDKLDEFISSLSKHPYVEIVSIKSEWEDLKEESKKSFEIAF